MLDKRTLHVKIDREFYDIPFSKIYHIAMAGRNAELHLRRSTLTLSSHITFTQLIEQLAVDKHFVVCGKGSIVNLMHVKCIEKNVFIMNNGDSIFISRRRFKDVKNLFFEYIIDF